MVFYMFFCLDAKEPKNQDCQKKSGNSALRLAKILKLARTQWSNSDHSYFASTECGLRQKEFLRSVRRNFCRFFLKVDFN